MLFGIRQRILLIVLLHILRILCCILYRIHR